MKKVSLRIEDEILERLAELCETDNVSETIRITILMYQLNNDACMRLTASTDALGNTTSYGYDELNMKVKAVNLLKDTSTISYTKYDLISVITGTNRRKQSEICSYDKAS